MPPAGSAIRRGGNEYTWWRDGGATRVQGVIGIAMSCPPHFRAHNAPFSPRLHCFPVDSGPDAA